MDDNLDQHKAALTGVCRAALRSFLASDARLAFEEPEDPAVSVVLVLYNRAELTLRCLRALSEERAIALEILVVDNASRDETSLLLDRLDGVRAIRNRENRGFLLAVNQAARRARGKYLLLLNNDAELLPGSLVAALRAIQRSDDVGAVGGPLILPDGRLQEAGSIVWNDGSSSGYGRGDSPLAPPYTFERDVDYCSGAFLLTPRELFLRGGGFDEDYAPAYYEEVDYCVRLWKAGKRVVYEPRAPVMHYEFASSASMDDAVKMQIEKRKTFLGKHAGWIAEQHGPGASHVLWARARGKRGRVLVIDDRVPHEFLGSGFPRSREILLALLELGYFVTFYPLSFPTEEWHDVYRDIPRETEVMVGWGTARIEEFLRERRGYYDRVVISRDHNLRRLTPFLDADPELFGGAGLVYDAEAIAALRHAAQRRLNGDAMPEAQLARALADETGLAQRADAVIAVSEAERRHFSDCGVSRVFTLGHVVAPAATQRPFASREGILFVGAIHEDTSPNADSVTWFTSEVLPELRRLLDEAVRFHVVGVNGSSRIAALAGDGVHVTGPVNDLAGFYDRARIFVAPTRFGAGIPLKAYHAAAHGLPIVCTTLVASQLGWRDGVEVLAVDDPTAFASRCAELYHDAELWETLRRGALARIREECSRDAFHGHLAQILREAVHCASGAAC